MVKKLYKQEMIYYMRSLLPVCVILMGIAVMGGMIHIFESDHWTYSIIANSSLGAYLISAVVTLIFATIFIVIRYYKNMFTGEGYLTLTLPVTFSQHLIAKLAAAMTASLGTFIVMFFSGLLFLGRAWTVEIYKVIEYISVHAIEYVGNHFWLYVVEFVILTIVALMAEILSYYMCISLGQMFRKRRILAAVAIYYGIYLVVQVIVTVTSIIIAIVVENIDLMAWEKWIEVHYKGMIHGLMIGGIIGSLVVSVIMFFICRTVLKRRLNLE